MRLIKIVIGLICFLIIFTACPDNSDDEFSCELKMKIIDNRHNNLLETSFYNSDTILLFQDNTDFKSTFRFDDIEYVLSITTGELRNFDLDRDLIFYLNMTDTDTLKISYETDPTNPCLGGGMTITGVNYNGQDLILEGDVYKIIK
jgi:hypothetical protein